MKISRFWGPVVCGLLITGAGAATAFADLAELQGDTTVTTEARTSLGYRSVSEHSTAARALEYDSLQSSPLFNVKIATKQEAYFLDFDLDFINDNDYISELHLHTKGTVRVDLRSERFFHNLDHIPYDNGYTGGEIYPPFPGPPPARNLTGTPQEGSRPDGVITDTNDVDRMRTYYSDDDPAATYGLRLDTNEAKFRIKHPSYPAHFNLAYWRYEKKGDKQLRFVGENCTTACHMQSRTRKIDRVTEEVKAEVDAHVGFIDFAVEALFRTFRDREPIPSDNFGNHFRGRLFAEPLEHSEDPDSKLSELTFKANTAPSGGLVGSASFTIGERENRSDLSSIEPVKAETDYYKTSADVTYTPGQNWTFNLRYRLLDMDSDNSDQLTAFDNSNVNPLEVRDSVDIKRAWYEMIVNYRPSPRLTLKGELRREDIDRSNTGPAAEHKSSATNPVEINPNWQLPDSETVTRAKIGFHSRLMEKSLLKLSGWLAFEHSDDPAYGASFSDSQELFLSSSYNPSPFWGMLANVTFSKQDNDDHELHGHPLDREKDQQNLSLGSWFIPREGLSFDLNYGYLRTDIDQDLMFGSADGFAIEASSTEYRQSVQSVTLGMNWQARENLSCRVEGYHIRSKASYSPGFADGVYTYNPFGTPFDAEATSADLKDISEINIQQNGLRGRLNWQIDDDWACTVEATFDDYDELGNDVYDGSVQTTMVSFSRRW